MLTFLFLMFSTSVCMQTECASVQWDGACSWAEEGRRKVLWSWHLTDTHKSLALLLLDLMCCAAFLAPIQQSSYRCPLPTACAGLYLCSTEMLQPGFSPRRITVREAEAPAGRAALRPQGWFGSPSYSIGGRKGNSDCCEDGALTPCGAVVVLYTPWRGGRTETWEKQWWWGRGKGDLQAHTW